MPSHLVRAFGSSQVHLAGLEDHDLLEARIFGAEATVTEKDPVECVCGARLKIMRGIVIVMKDAVVNCQRCKRLGHELGLETSVGPKRREKTGDELEGPLHHQTAVATQSGS